MRPILIQLFQQRQDRRAVDADGADKTELRRCIQCLRQMRLPALRLASVQREGGQDMLVDAVDIPPAGLDVRPQRREGHQRRVRLAVRNLTMVCVKYW